MYRIVKWTMIILSVLYLPCVLLVPFLTALRTSLLAWLLYAVFVAVPLFLCALNRKTCRPGGSGVDPDGKKKGIKNTPGIGRSHPYLRKT